MQDEYWVTVTDVAALRYSVSQQTDLGKLSHMGPLVQEAEKTKWDRLPLCAIAEAHKKEAERLTARGNPDANINDYTAICVEYFKYLQLYPYKDSPEYEKVVEIVHVLERAMTDVPGHNDLPEIPSPSDRKHAPRPSRALPKMFHRGH